MFEEVKESKTEDYGNNGLGDITQRDFENVFGFSQGFEVTGFENIESGGLKVTFINADYARRFLSFVDKKIYLRSEIGSMSQLEYSGGSITLTGDILKGLQAYVDKHKQVLRRAEQGREAQIIRKFCSNPEDISDVVAYKSLGVSPHLTDVDMGYIRIEGDCTYYTTDIITEFRENEIFFEELDDIQISFKSPENCEEFKNKWDSIDRLSEYRIGKVINKYRDNNGPIKTAESQFEITIPREALSVLLKSVALLQGVNCATYNAEVKADQGSWRSRMIKRNEVAIDKDEVLTKTRADKLQSLQNMSIWER